MMLFSFLGRAARSLSSVALQAEMVFGDLLSSLQMLLW